MKRKLKDRTELIKLKGIYPLYLEKLINKKFDPNKDPLLLEDYKTGLPLGLLPFNVWDLLPNFFRLNKRQVNELISQVKYACPFSENFYWGAYPVAYVCKKMPKLKVSNEDHIKFLYNELEDNYQKNNFNKQGILEMCDISRSFFGHGYIKSLYYNGEDVESHYFFININKNEDFIFRIWCEKSKK